MYIDTTLQVLPDTLDKLPMQSSDIIIKRDINIDNLDETSKESALIKLLAGYNTTRIDLPATRISDNSVSSIDIVSTNVQSGRIKVKVPQTGMVDYMRQNCRLDMHYTSRTTTFKSFNYYTLLIFKKNCCMETWDYVLRAKNTEE